MEGAVFWVLSELSIIIIFYVHIRTWLQAYTLPIDVHTIKQKFVVRLSILQILLRILECNSIN